MTRLQIEVLTSMRWQDYERRVLDQLLEDGLIICDDVEDRWSVGSSLSVPYTGLAVEMKLRDGRCALAQAMKYQAFANESFVALPCFRTRTGRILGVLSRHPRLRGSQRRHVRRDALDTVGSADQPGTSISGLPVRL
jgi:hypothetical protein